MGNRTSNIQNQSDNVEPVNDDSIRLIKIDWGNISPDKISIDKQGSGNDILVVTLNLNEAIVTNKDFIYYMDSGIVIKPENTNFNAIDAAPLSPELLSGENTNTLEKDFDMTPEADLNLGKTLGMDLPNSNPNPNPNTQKQALELEQIGGDIIDKTIEMATLYATEDNATIRLCSPFSSDIEEITLYKNNYVYILKSSLVAYTKGLIAENTKGSYDNIYEFRENDGFSLIKIKNTDSNITHKLWISGFGIITKHILQDQKTMEIDIDKLLTFGNGKYSVRRENNRVIIIFTGPMEFYSHSKSGLSYYRTSKAALLANKNINNNKEYNLAEIVVNTQIGGQFKNIEHKPFKNNNTDKHLHDLLRFVG